MAQALRCYKNMRLVALTKPSATDRAMSDDPLDDPVRHYRSVRLSRSLTQNHRAWHILDAHDARARDVDAAVPFHQLGRIGPHICSRFVDIEGDEDFLVARDPNDKDYGALMDAQLLKLAVHSVNCARVFELLPPDLKAKICARAGEVPRHLHGYEFDELFDALCKPYLLLGGRIPGLDYGWDIGEN
jgi:hypothetical protein